MADGDSTGHVLIKRLENLDEVRCPPFEPLRAYIKQKEKKRQTFGTPLGPTSLAEEDSLTFVKGRVLAQTTSDLSDLGLGRVLAERLQKLADGRGGDAVRGAGIEQRKGLAGTRLVVALIGVSTSQTSESNAPASFCVRRGR